MTPQVGEVWRFGPMPNSDSDVPGYYVIGRVVSYQRHNYESGITIDVLEAHDPSGTSIVARPGRHVVSLRRPHEPAYGTVEWVYVEP